MTMTSPVHCSRIQAGGPARARRAAPEGLATLMQEYLDGSSRAFRRLHAQVAPRMRGAAIVRLSDPWLADDVVQLAFLRAHRARRRFRWRPGNRDALVLSWYVAIARNAAIDVLRHRSRIGARTVSLAAPLEVPREFKDVLASQGHEQDVVEAEARRDTRSAVRRAISRLPPKQREVVELHKLQGLHMAEIARRLGVKEGCLRVRAHRAYRLLAEDLRTVAA
jgi:RNA polymerase sigma-70 factor (ECF subfamily)